MFFRELILLTVAGVCFANQYEGCPRIISRKEWGAEPQANYPIPLGRPAPLTIIHHTSSWPCYETRECMIMVRAIQNYHMKSLNWSDIGYSYLIGGDGNVYEGLGCKSVAFFAPGWNYKSLSVAFIGNFDGQEPSPKMLETARKLIACGRAHGSLTDNSHVLGAQQVIPATTSPGDRLYAQIKTWPEWMSLHSDSLQRSSKSV